MSETPDVFTVNEQVWMNEWVVYLMNSRWVLLRVSRFHDGNSETHQPHTLTLHIAINISQSQPISRAINYVMRYITYWAVGWTIIRIQLNFTFSGKTSNKSVAWFWMMSSVSYWNCSIWQQPKKHQTTTQFHYNLIANGTKIWSNIVHLTFKYQYTIFNRELSRIHKE